MKRARPEEVPFHNSWKHQRTVSTYAELWATLPEGLLRLFYSSLLFRAPPVEHHVQLGEGLFALLCMADEDENFRQQVYVFIASTLREARIFHRVDTPLCFFGRVWRTRNFPREMQIFVAQVWLCMRARTGSRDVAHLIVWHAFGNRRRAEFDKAASVLFHKAAYLERDWLALNENPWGTALVDMLLDFQ